MFETKRRMKLSAVRFTDVEAAAQLVWRCWRGVLQFVQTDEG